MKANINTCISIARDIVIDLYQRGYGTEENLNSMLDAAESVIAPRIMEHDRELICRAHMAYVEAVKKEGDK